ncbi:MAG: ubiquinol-cytochrome C reductase [Altererythrobacter sp.]|nr:ubiquinol-cytochrome C reductase [Erythrobacter sp.]MAW91122.1 ubiquinol-cytochrome C reductase [Altererythrobacter sp.]MBK63319.1 ubiquinol-cytochrome C reductase [Altererythrobacter sp.]|tara:strand:- start:4314 stop:5642 length:1329 start_codon:yes stop_codon:yes gene_type:complete
MADEEPPSRHRSVPSSRIGRLGGFTRLAGGVAGGMLSEGARRLASGERPRLDQLLLTPANARRLTDRLAHLRGAAMKLGQMISMDAGDLLPPELSDILSRLRDRADFMPPRQLDKVLQQEWGADWRRQFRRFEPRPIAAASIGQVHRALTPDGRTLAIKVQYPGVAQSIDSDVDNVAALLKLTGLLPPELDIAPLLAAAKDQLHEEADYEREGQMMARFGNLLATQPQFVVPTLDADLTTPRVLAMSYEEGSPIEALAESGQETRDEVFSHLVELVARELFEAQLMQTDPNFANYRWQASTGRIVLLDFGAAREVSNAISQDYRRLLSAGLAEDREDVMTAAIEAGFVNPRALDRHPEAMRKAVDIAVTQMARPEPLDFGDRAFVPEIRETVMPIAQDRDSWHLPPAETLFVQRKISGTALLGARLKARVDVRGIVQRILDQ